MPYATRFVYDWLRGVTPSTTTPTATPNVSQTLPLDLLDSPDERLEPQRLESAYMLGYENRCWGAVGAGEEFAKDMKGEKEGRG